MGVLRGLVMDMVAVQKMTELMMMIVYFLVMMMIDDDDDGYPANSPHDKIPPLWEYVINR